MTDPRIMSILLAVKSGAQTRRQIADRLRIDYQTVKVQTANAERLGLISSSGNPVTYTLTSEGWTLIAHVGQVVRR